MSKLNLWLIRHGETEVNTGIWSTKPAESCLTPLGKKQARYIATKIMQQPDLLIVSPLQRAKQTAQYLLKRWPNTELNIWPIYEHIYLSPVRLSYLDPLSRRKEIELYWSRLDPNYCDGKDAESFASFLKRVANFHHQIRKLQGFIVVIGHGQFLKAYQLALTQGFHPNAEWMQLFRQQETSNPIKNGEIIELIFE